MSDSGKDEADSGTDDVSDGGKDDAGGGTGDADGGMNIDPDRKDGAISDKASIND